MYILACYALTTVLSPNTPFLAMSFDRCIGWLVRRSVIISKRARSYTSTLLSERWSVVWFVGWSVSVSWLVSHNILNSTILSEHLFNLINRVKVMEIWRNKSKYWVFHNHCSCSIKTGQSQEPRDFNDDRQSIQLWFLNTLIGNVTSLWPHMSVGRSVIIS